ncbi:hypothetical protein AXG93_4620s1010 [Marchantia polymorpha subsp. ruderalis]|uniref:Reverse transcriptase Ty1/copia-type domain-containing protein n=1 Tax=Marchantia polymorpha subsp. ruderalis TaxID=1480154 RepID=A0A176VWU4_MARPO|nr:hypothetical protein AXG93_4620s1010 [Marchantia polymorpha subsp. ruderalis]
MSGHHMSAKRFVKGLPYLPSSREHKCITCVLSKQHRIHKSKKPAKQSTRPLELIHTDVCGPAVAGIEFKYMLIFIDDYSRCWDPHNKRVVVSANVTVFETVAGDFQSDKPFVDIFSSLLDDDTALPIVSPTDKEQSDLTAPSDILQPERSELQALPTTSTTRSDVAATSTFLDITLPRRNSSRMRRLPARYDDTSHQLNVVETIKPITDQLSFQQAKLHHDWWKAMQEEFDALITNHTWELVELPKAKKVLTSRWIYKAKQELNPTRTLLKARLVARGLEQTYGVDYNEMFAHVVCWSTLRAMIALSVTLGWTLHHMDVITVFLNGKLKEQIYMQQPLGFEELGK